MIRNLPIIWDFDGVIVDSMDIRSQGFSNVLGEFDKDDVAQLLDFHKKNGGKSRFEKFEYFFNEVLEMDVDNHFIFKYVKLFSDDVKRKINKGVLIEEILLYIKERHTIFDMHIVSASHYLELQYICRNLGIYDYFKTINGTQNKETTKSDIIRDLMYVFDYDDAILIGDSVNDLEAAINNNIYFIPYNFSPPNKLKPYKYNKVLKDIQYIFGKLS